MKDEHSLRVRPADKPGYIVVSGIDDPQIMMPPPELWYRLRTTWEMLRAGDAI